MQWGVAVSGGFRLVSVPQSASLRFQSPPVRTQRADFPHCEVLAEAAKHLSEVRSPVTLLADSGVENVNDTVDQFLFGGTLKRVLAQVEIVESNSTVESWWRNLKHSWLFINSLDNRATVQRLVSFYVEQYNGVMPHSALDWRTPDEIYFGGAEDVASKLEVVRRAKLA